MCMQGGGLSYKTGATTVSMGAAYSMRCTCPTGGCGAGANPWTNVYVMYEGDAGISSGWALHVVLMRLESSCKDLRTVEKPIPIFKKHTFAFQKLIVKDGMNAYTVYAHR